MIRYRLNVRALYAALDACRTHDDLSWRGLGRQVGLSASTFSRMATGSTPDADALVALIIWLRVPLDRFVVAEEIPDREPEETDAPEVTR